ncbi:hypothetical protein [Streptomyces chromofuscus]|uniref:Lipoprotein n=1 Tax=Streptomyces chromofuscus TaxID=42881 RepID=A0A7M2T3X9_STRCW|nr:hypothetical protein [Streptomyces chromofuscus]QOV43370.1 hypothetical protein IPT68_27060 [Streptomyces chromofuscus]GGT41852.1 lipoprotein [Streptomyces chromofuscus]
MPISLSPRMPSGPRRRTLLASAAGVALLTGCSGGPGGSDTTGGSPSAADRARARAARDSDALVARYDAVLAAHPGLAQRLKPLREEAVRHAQAFGGVAAQASATAAAPAGGKASPTDAAPAGGQASPTGAAPAGGKASPVVPGTEQAALAELAAAERALADRRTEALLEMPGELARLLASVAAAGAAHAYLLTEGEGKA